MAELGPEHPRNLIPELCKQFYHLGWVTGTGGGISIKDGNKIYIAPSGVQKERMQHDDMFVQTIDDEDLELPPPEKRLKKSQCTPLFMLAYKERGAGAVIHTHSPHAVRCTLLYDKEFIITHQEMIKGIRDANLDRFLRYDEKLVVPIIENTPFERDLAGSLAKALQNYPGTSAVLVRRHGVYVWGKNWQEAKTMSLKKVCRFIDTGREKKKQCHYTEIIIKKGDELKSHIQSATPSEYINYLAAKNLNDPNPKFIYDFVQKYPQHSSLQSGPTECYDYLFEMAVEMKKLGLDPAHNPETGKSVSNGNNNTL